MGNDAKLSFPDYEKGNCLAYRSALVAAGMEQVTADVKTFANNVHSYLARVTESGHRRFLLGPFPEDFALVLRLLAKVQGIAQFYEAEVVGLLNMALFIEAENYEKAKVLMFSLVSCNEDVDVYSGHFAITFFGKMDALCAWKAMVKGGFSAVMKGK